MQNAKPAERQVRFGFGANMARPRRKLPTDGRSTQELVAEFLKTKEVTKCPTRYADGAIKASGYYEW